MKKHSLLKCLLITLFLVVLASWTLQITKVSGSEFVTEDASKIGLFTLATYINIVFQYFSQVFLYILAVGGLYGVLHKIPQYRVLLDKITNGFRDREWIFIVAVGLVLALLSSMAGLSIVLLLLFPFVISVMLLMGYDKITAAMLTIGSTIAGLIGSAFSANDTYGISAVLGQIVDETGLNAVGVNANELVGFKIALLLISLAIVLINTIIYGKKHQDREHLVKGIFIPEKVSTKNKNVVPLVVVLDVLLVVLALAFISWDILNVNLFTEMTEKFVEPTGSALSKGIYGALNTVLGISTSNAFGYWTLLEAAVVVLLASWLISFMYRVKFSEYLSAFGEGAKKALLPAMLVVIAYVVLVSATNVQFELTILRPLLSLTGDVQILTMCLVAIVYSFFTVESYYGITSAASYVLALTVFKKVGLVALIWQSMYGLTMFFAPTSVILLATLSYLDVNYLKWLKAIWKILLELFIAIVIVLLIV